MTQFIFITGGVVSSLGKGVASAAIGAILEARRLKVAMLKLDPYINVDPGTMSPFQHGEVFVTEDGAETDLDLGHYERFVSAKMKKCNNFTAGQVYESVIAKERRGDYLGGTVQVIPHITDEIKIKIRAAAADPEIAMVEIGGTVGDIESLPFLEAIRQMRSELGRSNTLFIHLSYVPYLPMAGEIKTKPTQHSVKELREIGIQPDILLCRMDRALPDEEKNKIALFCNVEKKAVISCSDVKSVYEIPHLLHGQGIDELICEQLSIASPPADLSLWQRIIEASQNPSEEVDIAMVGKYIDSAESYKSLAEAINHASIHTGIRINIRYVDSEAITSPNAKALLGGVDAILVPGGFGARGIEGKIQAVRFAREGHVPFLGICLGMQVALIEYARHVVGLKDANSTEFDLTTQHPVVTLIGLNDDGKIAKQVADANLGGTMRLGAQHCALAKGSLVEKIYRQEHIAERHRHRYEVNNDYVASLEKAGLKISGRSLGRESLVEAIELPSHPWFVGCQFHPEFTSTPREGHPLFSAYALSALLYKKKRLSKEAS